MGTLDDKLESNLLKNNQIEIKGNNTIEFTAKLTSLNRIDSKYEMYYTMEASVDPIANTAKQESGYAKITYLGTN